MKATPIPQFAREVVGDRDSQTCQRCGSPASDWHHRRSRRRRDFHTHCPCNGIMLCRTCHSWAHGHPMRAVLDGLIIPVMEDEPWREPYKAYDGQWYSLRCNGDVVINMN